MATSKSNKGKPALYYTTLAIIIAAFSLTATQANAKSPRGIDKVISKVDEINVPQMLATVSVQSGACIAGAWFEVHRYGIGGTSVQKLISKRLKLAGATHWVITDYSAGVFGQIEQVYVVPMVCTEETLADEVSS